MLRRFSEVPSRTSLFQSPLLPLGLLLIRWQCVSFSLNDISWCQVQGKREAIAALIRRLAADQSPDKTFDFPNLGFEGEEEEEKAERLSELMPQHEKIKINLKPKVQTSEDASAVKRAPSEPMSSLAASESGAGAVESPKLQWKKAKLAAS